MCVPALQFHYTAKKSKQEAMPVHVFHFRIKCLFLPKAPTVHKYLRTLYRSAMHSQMRTYNAQIIPPCNIRTEKHKGETFSVLFLVTATIYLTTEPIKIAKLISNGFSIEHDKPFNDGLPKQKPALRIRFVCWICGIDFTINIYVGRP